MVGEGGSGSLEFVQKLLLAALPLALALSACDREPADDLGTADRIADEADADEAPEGDDAAPGLRDGEARHGKHRKLARVCEALSCSPEQQTQIEQLFAARPRHERGHDREGRAEANAALATAFRSDGLSASDLQAYREATRRDGDDKAAGMTELATGVHAVLTPEQRSQLGTMIAERGAFLFGGKGGKHAKHAKHAKPFEGGKAGAEERHARRAAKLCEKLSCTEAQVPRVQAALAKLQKPERDDTAQRALGEAFATDGFGAGDVDTYLTALAARGDAHRDQMETVALELHGILDADQRATVADKIERRGLSAVVGGRKGKRHGKRHGGKKGRRGRGGKRHGGDRPQADGPHELGLG
jgi:Spy/CpxP family protein refolding chaperone